MMRRSATILGVILGTVSVVGCAEQNNQPVSHTPNDSNLPLAELIPEDSTPSSLLATSEQDPYTASSPMGYQAPGLIAPPPGGPSGLGQVHLIQPGQTLYSLAVKYYNDGQQWPRILEANSERISDPGKIRVGTKLIIP